MIPSKSEWAGWNATERLTYIGQALVVPSLLLTVCFSYLGLREARLSRSLAKEMFAGESAPQLKIVGVRLGHRGQQPRLYFSVKNEGDSEATLDCLGVHRLSRAEFEVSCGEGYFFKGAKIGKAQTIEHPWPIESVLSSLPARVNSVSLIEPGVEAQACVTGRSNEFLVTIRFKDIFANDRLSMQYLRVCSP